MDYYQRNLPHWHPENTTVFLTWRLYGTYNKYRIEREHISGGKAFLEMDRALDAAEYGPKWLTDPRLAQMVMDALNFGAKHLKYYTLIAYVIMPNHVHVVLTPRVPLPRITKSIKGFTAREANKILGRTGERFWQDESYDHWVRNEKELQKIIAYIERNPVSAGLADRIEDWPWSSASLKINTGMNAYAT